MARALVIAFSDLARDPRPQRQLEALAAEHDLIAAGFGPPASAVGRFVDIRPPPSALAARANQATGLRRIAARRYERAYWGNRLIGCALDRLADTRPDVVIANDVHTLPLALRLAGDAPVLFDAHEYYPEHFVQVRWWRAVMAPYFKWMCAEFMPRARAATTVSPGIAGLYRAAVGIEPEVITNAPPRAALSPGEVGRPVRLFHHGLADPRRRLGRMIEAVRLLDERFVLDMMLMGSSRGIRDLRRAARGDPRIGFRPPVPMSEIPRVANEYDVGVFMLEPRTPNQRHVLPNKLFEFIQARLAVAVGPSPDMAELVRSRELGVVSEDFTPASFARAVGGLDEATIAAMKQRSHAAADELCAEHNAVRWRAVVEGLGA